MRAFCRDNGLTRSVIFEWLQEQPEFADQYARARELQADSYADDISAIADDDTIPPDDRRVRIDARKWIAGKLRPKAYGDKVDLTHAAPGGGPIKTESKLVIELVDAIKRDA